METNYNSFKTEIVCQSSYVTYNLSFTYKNPQFVFKLSKDIDSCYWEESFSLTNLQAKYSVLYFFDKDSEFFDFLVKCLKENAAPLSEGSHNFMNLTFFINLNNMKKEEILFKLGSKRKEATESLSHILNVLPKIEQNHDQIKNELQVMKDEFEKKLNGIKGRIDKKLETIMSMIEKSKQGNTINQVHYNNYPQIHHDFSFVPNIANNCHFSLSNENKTLKRKSNLSWIGFRCEPPQDLSPKMSFSVKIDEVSPRNGIMIGWCMKNADNSHGYHCTPQSFCLYLNNGQFLNSKNYDDYINRLVYGKIGQVYTTIIHTFEKKIEFLLDGSALSPSKSIAFNNEDIMFLCPFVDLYDAGNQVSIVSYTNSINLKQ